MSPLVEVDGLVKRYDGRSVVDGVSFEITQGEILGIVGPNGAGKTTTIECIEGLRKPDGGSVRTLGLDPLLERRALLERVGIQLQESSLPLRLRVNEALKLFASFYRRAVPVDALLDQLDLADKRNGSFGQLSGGQRQRLFIALALVNDPDLIFLDELTTGLDPHARHKTWDLVRSIRDRGKTVLLTTHFMEEAERLCDRVAILDRGKIVALDTPANLIRSLGDQKRLVLTVEGNVDATAIRAISGVERVVAGQGSLEVEGTGDGLTTETLAQLAASGVTIRELRTEGGNLEDVFLELTGRSVSDGEAA